ncbi:MAG: hypothetical protein FJ009_13600 [Chloroflexi bacterium]|nr:hypothetical protein [Chloroflexota bacterium]
MTLVDFSSATILSGLIITVALIILVADWRVALFALLAQYVLSASLLAGLVPLPLAIVRVLSGAFAAAILYFTFRRAADNHRRDLAQAEDDAARLVVARLYRLQVFVVGFPFRVFALALVAVGIVGIASSMTFLGLSSDLLFGGLWLIAAGVLVAILSRDVLRLGLGILLFTSGFAILETATESSLLLYGLINISDLLLALVCAHLAALPPTDGLRRRRGELR